MQKKNFSFSCFCLYSLLVFLFLQINAFADEPIQSEGSVLSNYQTTRAQSSFEWKKLDDGIFYMLRNENMTTEGINQSNTTNIDRDISNFGNEEIADKQSITDMSINSPNILLHLVKIDPKLYSFNLYGSFLEDSDKKYTLPKWGKDKDLLVAINASMYLPDNTTSIGYMRSYDNINSGRISNAMDGFFLSNHKDDGIATFTDKYQTNWNEHLNDYNVVIQNFRILGNYDFEAQHSNVLWANESGKHSISAYGNDIDGNIIFIFSQTAITVNELACYLVSLKDDGIIFKNLLYAEGGREAALYINTPNETIYINGFGSTSLDFLTPIPNVLGVTKSSPK